MSSEQRLRGLCIKTSPLGENDRLITILSEEKGISRFAAPGARKPKSSLACVSPLILLDLQVFGRKNLKSVRQIKIIKSYSKLGKSIECLAAAQAITELTFLLVGNNDAQENYLSTVLVHLDRLQDYKFSSNGDLLILAISIQSLMHLLAIGGLSLPLHYCCQSGKPINPPIGNWEWNCYFNPQDGFSYKEINNHHLKLNASEIALLQRLLFPDLPIKSDGELLGPKKVWLKILNLIQSWIINQLSRELSSLKILSEFYK